MDRKQIVKDINDSIASVKSRARKAMADGATTEVIANLMLDELALFLLLHGASKQLTDELDKKKAA